MRLRRKRRMSVEQWDALPDSSDLPGVWQTLHPDSQREIWDDKAAEAQEGADELHHRLVEDCLLEDQNAEELTQRVLGGMLVSKAISAGRPPESWPDGPHVAMVEEERGREASLEIVRQLTTYGGLTEDEAVELVSNYWTLAGYALYIGLIWAPEYLDDT